MNLFINIQQNSHLKITKISTQLIVCKYVLLFTIVKKYFRFEIKRFHKIINYFSFSDQFTPYLIFWNNIIVCKMISMIK